MRSPLRHPICASHWTSCVTRPPRARITLGLALLPKAWPRGCRKSQALQDRYNQSMQLNDARLCLDCQEIHEADRCPVCTSEAFGFITRWIKIDAAPTRVSPHEKSAGRTSKVETYREILNLTPQRSTAARWLRKGGLVVAAGYLARWGWQIAAHHNRPPQRERAETPDHRQGDSTAFGQSHEADVSTFRDRSSPRSQSSK